MGRFIEQEKNNQTSQKTVVQEKKEPSNISKVGGVLSRTAEIPNALISVPVSTIKNIIDFAKTRDWKRLEQSTLELRKNVLNIPKEVAEGAKEGFWAQSDIPQVSTALGMEKSSLPGVATDIVTDILTPGGQIREGARISQKILGRTGQKVAERLSGVTEPASKTFEQFSTLQGKAQGVKNKLDEMLRVDFTEKGKEAYKIAKEVGKDFMGAGETLNQKAQKLGVPMDSWDNAKNYIEKAKTIAGKKVEEVGKMVGKLDYRTVGEDVYKWIDDNALIKGKEWRNEMVKKLAPTLESLKNNTIETGYKVRNLVDDALNQKNKLVNTGQGVLSDEDRLFQVLSQSLRAKLNEFTPLQQAQKAYSDLSQLSSKAAQKMGKLMESKDKLTREFERTLADDMAKFNESQRIARENFENKMKAFSIQKAIADIAGKAIKTVPGVIIPTANRASQIIKEEEKK